MYIPISVRISCTTIADDVFTIDDPDGLVRHGECPSFCPEVLLYQYELYGVTTYSGVYKYIYCYNYLLVMSCE